MMAFGSRNAFKAEHAILATDPRLLEPAKGSERLVCRAVNDHATVVQSASACMRVASVPCR